MRLTRIYQATPLAVGQTIELTAAANQHLINVLRLSADGNVIIFNGEGGEYTGKLVQLRKKMYGVQIEQFVERHMESPLTIHLAQGISRNDRMDLTLQKAVELGVKRITPLITERCQISFNQERLQKRMQHWQGIIVSATEQCGRTHVPLLHEPVSLTQWLATPASHTLGLVLHHRANCSLQQLPAKMSEVSLLIGPEGGLSAREIAAAEAAQFQAICLGPRVLRTETAALTAIAVLQAKWGDF
jgi:16S rRNA (uracil1498-N3)-methyltransferase